jgi:hypothetical protein
MFLPIRASGRATSAHHSASRYASPSGFAERSGVVKALALGPLRGVTERDILAEVALRVEKRQFGVSQLGRADEGEDHEGGGLALSILGRGEPSGRIGQVRGWWSISSCRTSSGVAAVGIPFPRNFDHGWLTWADKVGISDKASVIIPRKGS